MDANKLVKLKQIGYHMNAVCGLCKHSLFMPGTEWGTCGLHGYEHLKHTEKSRQVSVHKFGGCLSFEKDPGLATTLGAFEQFLV
jgi:hypothetical protein